MNRLERAVLLGTLAKELASKGGWCGLTHLQKAMFFLQQVCGVPITYDFILYKHGPFAFDLQDELTGFLADHIFELVPMPSSSASYRPTSLGDSLKERFGNAAEPYESSLVAVAELISSMPLGQLERFSMALLLTLRGEGQRSPADRARELHKIRPHVSLEEAAAAVDQVDKVLQDPKIAQTCPT